MTAKNPDIPVERRSTHFPTDDVAEEKAISDKLSAQLHATNLDRDSLLSYGNLYLTLTF